MLPLGILAGLRNNLRRLRPYELQGSIRSVAKVRDRAHCSHGQSRIEWNHETTRLRLRLVPLYRARLVRT